MKPHLSPFAAIALSPLLFALWFLVLGIRPPAAAAETALFRAEMIFDGTSGARGHVHASSLIACPNGDLRVVWYENGSKLPDPPYYNDRQDKSADVRIAGSRLPHGTQAWEAPYVVSDTFGVSDNNPCLVIDRDSRLWLFHSTMLGAPAWTWGSTILQYHISSDYQKPGAPVWHRTGVLIPQPTGLERVMEEGIADAANLLGGSPPEIQAIATEMRKRIKDPMQQRLGWMPRVHPLIRHDGALLLPLSNENFEIPMIAITSDAGATWTFSDPIPSIGLLQPSLVELADHSMLAYFRNGDPRHRIKFSRSQDGGTSWSRPEYTDRPHPGSGLEVIRLPNDHLILVSNNKEERQRDKLAVSISDDHGATWRWTRQIEDVPGGRFDYPSIVFGADGLIHVTYSHELKTIKHVAFNEAWVVQAP